VTGQWFSAGTPIYSTNKTDRHDISEILLKVMQTQLTQTKIHYLLIQFYHGIYSTVAQCSEFNSKYKYCEMLTIDHPWIGIIIMGEFGWNSKEQQLLN